MKEMLPDMRPYGLLLDVSVSKMKEMLPDMRPYEMLLDVSVSFTTTYTISAYHH
jgi:hypothetical protein